ncbi:MAG TPA: DsbA family protein [Thermoplasmata archaeon]
MKTESPVEIVHFADPWCWWSWGLEPVLHRLKEVYGENLKVTYKMGGQFESLQGWMEEYDVDQRSTVEWIHESIELTKMPIRPDYYFRTGATSSYPACRAFKAAQLQSEELAPRYLRRMMEAFGLECRAATDDEIIRLAEEIGLDGRRVRKDSHSEAVAKALDVDRDEMHRSGVNFLSLLVRNRDGRQVIEGEVFTAKPFETIIDDLAPGLPKRSPADILDYVEHHRALTPAHEIAEVFRIPDEDARHRLETLAAAGLLTAHAFDGIAAWRWADKKVEKLPMELVRVSHVPPEVQVESLSDLKPIVTEAVQSLYTEVATRPDKAYHFPLGLDALRYLGYPEETFGSCRRPPRSPSPAWGTHTWRSRCGQATPCLTSDLAPGRTSCSPP